MAAIRETMKALHKIGAIDDQTMQSFDNCLTSVRPLSQRQIDCLWRLLEAMHFQSARHPGLDATATLMTGNSISSGL